MWHFLTGENFGQLFGPARRVFGRDDADLQVSIAAQRLFQRGNRLRFVVFDTNEHLLCLQNKRQNAAAFQHFPGAVLHQSVIGRDVGFTLSCIDNQCIHAAQAALQLGGGRETGPAQARDAGLMNLLHQLAALNAAIITEWTLLNPAILSVRRHKQAHLGQCRRVSRHMWCDFRYRTGGGRVDRQHPAAAKGQRLTTQNAISRAHGQFAFRADMLLQGQNKLCRQRQFAQRRTV